MADGKLTRLIDPDIVKVRCLRGAYCEQEHKSELTDFDVFYIARRRQGLGTCRVSARIDFEEFNGGNPLCSYIEAEYIAYLATGKSS